MESAALRAQCQTKMAMRSAPKEMRRCRDCIRLTVHCGAGGSEPTPGGLAAVL